MTVYDFRYACPAASESWRCPYGAAVVGEARRWGATAAYRLRCAAGHVTTVDRLPGEVG